MFRFLYSQVALLLMTSTVFAQETAETVAAEGIKNIENVVSEQWSTAKSLIDTLIDFCVKYSFQVIGGLIVLFLGWIVAGYVAKWLLKFFNKKAIDVTVSKFIVGIVKILIIVFAVIVALGKFGIEIAPLIAGISVVGFGTSFALQGTLSNFAAGISLIFTKPFKVGEIIEVAGVMGEVTDIKLPRTELKTIDGTKIVVPNNHIVGEIIQNYSDFKRMKVVIGISYSSNIQQAIQIVKEIVEADSRVINAKEAKIGVEEFADSSINICARLRVKQDEYFDTLFSINNQIFEKFSEANIEIPFPQRDVHLISQDTSAKV